MQRAHSKSRRAESNRGQLGRSTLTVAEKATGSILGFFNPKVQARAVAVAGIGLTVSGSTPRAQLRPCEL